MRGIPDILFCRILVFMWPFGALAAADSKNVEHGRRMICVVYLLSLVWG